MINIGLFVQDISKQKAEASRKVTTTMTKKDKGTVRESEQSSKNQVPITPDLLS